MVVLLQSTKRGLEKVLAVLNGGGGGAQTVLR